MEFYSKAKKEFTFYHFLNQPSKKGQMVYGVVKQIIQVLNLLNWELVIRPSVMLAFIAFVANMLHLI